MEPRTAGLVAIVAGLAAAIVPELIGQAKQEERNEAHLRSDVAGVIAKAATAAPAKLSADPQVKPVAIPEPEPEPPAVEPRAVEPPAPATKARVLVCSPTWHCPYCIQQRPNVEALAKRGWTVGTGSDADFQFMTLTDADARRLYGVTRWPATVYLGGDGKVLQVATGVQTSDRLESQLKRYR